MTRTVLYLNLFLIFLAGPFLNPQPTQAISKTRSILPGFTSFSRSIQNGEADVLQGVYVPNVLALSVIQQPADNPYYVSNQDGETTQFSMVSQYGSIGLLAHNTLAGRFFAQLAIGQEVRLVYGDGTVKYFVIGQVLRFQALQPVSVSSSFRDLERNEVLTTGEVFNRVYTGGSRVVFQTCIAEDGISTWGRLFFVAIPKG